MTKKNETSTIRIYKSKAGYLNVLSERAGKSQVDYISQAVYYLHKTGLNVYGGKEKNIPDLIKNLENKMVGFMRSREKMFFIPMEKAFLEQVAYFKKVSMGLENFDVIKFINSEEKNNDKSEKKSLIIPKNFEEENSLKNDEIKDIISLEKKTENNEDCEELSVEVKQLKNENEIFRDTINYLLKKIKKGSPLSGVKFSIDIQQKDINRIKNLL